MRLLRQPNVWSCLPTSVSMLTGISLEYMIEKLGHDGSRILWPSLPEPLRRQSFHIEEIQAFLFGMDWCLVPYAFGVRYNPSKEDGPVIDYDFSTLGITLLHKYDGILLGTYVGRPDRHAVAWNAKEFCIYDPAGKYSPIEDFNPHVFQAARRT